MFGLRNRGYAVLLSLDSELGLVLCTTEYCNTSVTFSTNRGSRSHRVEKGPVYASLVLRNGQTANPERIFPGLCSLQSTLCLMISAFVSSVITNAVTHSCSHLTKGQTRGPSQFCLFVIFVETLYEKLERFFLKLVSRLELTPSLVRCIYKYADDCTVTLTLHTSCKNSWIQ